MYTVDYYIKKFEAIPSIKFVVGSFRYFDDYRCSLGHCLRDVDIDRINDHMERYGKTPKITEQEIQTTFKEAFDLCLLFNSGSPAAGSQMVIDINNGDHPKYQQATPKQRILAALHDIKKLQQPEEKKDRIVYVSVPASITEQAKELVTN